MKKVLLMLCLVFAGIQVSNAQVDFGIKAGLNFNSDGFKPSEEIKKIAKFDTSSKLGYHVGLWTRFKLPIVGLYVRPELVYTALKNEVEINSLGIKTKADYGFKKIDLPVLLGYKFAGTVNVFAGPSFQYIVGKDFSWDKAKEIKANNFTVGMQLGAGVEFGSVGVDVRWERGFSDTESKVIGNKISNFNFDTRVNQIILGLSYKF